MHIYHISCISQSICCGNTIQFSLTLNAHTVSLHFCVNRIPAVSYFRFLSPMSFLPVVNSHHGLAALLGFNSNTNIYNYCYPACLIIGESCSVVLSNTPCRRSLNEAGRLILGSKLMLTVQN